MQQEALQMVDTGSYVYITDQATLEYIAAVQCEKYVMTDIIFNIQGLAFALSKKQSLLGANQSDVSNIRSWYD